MKVVDDAKRTNEGLSEEVLKLRTQVTLQFKLFVGEFYMV